MVGFLLTRRNRKCDRKHPCSNCTKREGTDTTACSYAAPSSRKKSQNQVDSSPGDMQSRIDRLEGLVLQLVHNVTSANTDGARNSISTSHSVAGSGSSAQQQVRDGEASMADDDSDVDDHLAKSIGFLKVDAEKGKSMYIGQEHWHLILSDIAEVKNYFTSHRKELETSYEKVKSSKPALAKGGPTLLLGAHPASEEELRAELPPQSSVLALCSRYFNSMESAVGIIHSPTFLQQLRNHWQDPSKTPIMWLGLLYSILCLAMLSYHKVGDEPAEWQGHTLELAAEYRLRTVQCLMIGDYTKPVEYTVETMLLYVFGEYTTRWDADIGLWMIATSRVYKGVPYDEIILFDAKLRRIMQELPPHLKLGSLASSRDTVPTIVAKFSLDILYQKIMCLLHRKYMARARQNPRYSHSRRSAIEASLQAMEHMQTLHRESQANGRLRTVAWYVNSIATREFILPAMLIVLDLHYDNLAEQSGPPDDAEGAFRWSPEQRAKMMSSLEDAAMIWKSLADGSMEAFKGWKTVEIMLQKLKEPIHSSKSTESINFVADSMVTLASSAAALDPTTLSPKPAHAPTGGLGDFKTELSPFMNSNSSAFMGMEFSLPAPNFGEGTAEGMNPQLPLSIFTDTEPNLNNSFDWFWQGALENYTQLANWGADQSFQIYGDGDVKDQEANMMNTQ
ncbi:hypothetical protein UVI_02037310 [Ustilaginoidea virens]|uniref:Uncharacterized protein n=1 Tax=Ustilaginoidea virens TaxID=1159556 RepID=A0A1B5L464_USTVR|nr:hypothetical protein UVI_02037310 [Ustilaginoidea virens]